MTTPFVATDIGDQEGLRLAAYPDPLSPRAQAMAMALAKRPAGWTKLSGAPWSIGYGHTGPEVHEGLVWTEAQAIAARNADIALRIALLDRVLTWWRTLNDPRQDVLVSLVFNMGWDNPRTPAHEGLSAFGPTLELIHGGQFEAAGDHLAASLWARQTKTRATRLIAQLRTGQRAA